MARKGLRTKVKGKRAYSMVELQKNLRRYDHKKNVLKKKQAEAIKREADRQRQKLVKRHRLNYRPTHRILLVGEGNCSFARALIRKWRQDVADELKKKGYPVPSDAHIRKGVPVDYDLLREIRKDRLRSRMSDAQFARLMDDVEGNEKMLKKLGVYEAPANGNDDSQEDLDHDEDFEDEDDYDEDLEDEDDHDEDDEDGYSIDPEDFEDEDDSEGNQEADDNEEDIDYTNAVEDYDSGLQINTFRNVGRHLLVTCYDSIADAMKKYPDLMDILLELYSAGVRVVFDVDCANMVKTFKDANLIPKKKFDRIVFNFPHVGSGEKDRDASIAENQNLLLRFLTNSLPLLAKPPSIARDPREDGAALQAAMEANATDVVLKRDLRSKRAQVLSRGGQIIITTKLGEPYDSWHIPKLVRVFNHNQNAAQIQREDANTAEPGSLALRFPRLAVLRTEPFLPEVYPGYRHRRTIGFKIGINDDNNAEITKAGAKTFIFIRAPMGFVDKGLGISTDAAGGEELVKKRNVALKRPSKNKAVGGKKYTKESRKRR